MTLFTDDVRRHRDAPLVQAMTGSSTVGFGSSFLRKGA
jgi:hypothetical protein